MNLRSLLGNVYHPLNLIVVNKSVLLNNYSYLSRLRKGLDVAPVLKSNAYGHGLIQVAKALDQVRAPFFCVDSLYEAYELINNNIKTKIFIMGYVDPDNLKVKNLPFSYAIYDKKIAAAISKYQPHAGIHLFVDTGMHREGIRLEDLLDFLNYIKSLNLKIEGLMSHLALSENYASRLTKKQIKNFQKAVEILENAGVKPKWIHLGNSSAVLSKQLRKVKIGNLARCGMGVYGVDPEGKDKILMPSLELTSKLTQVKFLRKGEYVGYDFTYKAKKDIRIGILPIGYFDGVDRRLSNKGFVSVGQDQCRIVGRVSMNLTAIDLSEVKYPKVGQIVKIYSKKQINKNSILSASSFCGTIPYDLLIGLASSTKRIVI